MEAQYGALIYGDLKENTLTIELDQPVIIRAGNYALIRIDNINDKEKLEEFLNQTK